MKERTFSSPSYRYGFNGMEKDDQFKGEGNSYTTEFRMDDPRLGRWLSKDPIFSPWESPYCNMSNNPIVYNDPFGDDIDLGKGWTKVRNFIRVQWARAFHWNRAQKALYDSYKKGGANANRTLVVRKIDRSFNLHTGKLGPKNPSLSEGGIRSICKQYYLKGLKKIKYIVLHFI